MKKWIGYKFQSSTRTTQEFKDFCQDYNNYLKRKLAPEIKIERFSINFFYFYLFVRNKGTGKFAYISISDVRHFPDKWWKNILIRSVKDLEDYTGGSNNYCSLSEIKEKVLELTKIRGKI